MRILLAMGGNVLLGGDGPDAAADRHSGVEAAAAAIAEMASEHEVVLAHGNDLRNGHLLELALRNALPDRDVISLLPKVVVDADNPTSDPYAIAEIRSLRVLVDAGALVICAGGGMPVALDKLGTLRSVEAVIDKDLIAALLARRLDADLLLMLTDVNGVHTDWGGPHQRPIAGAEPADLRAMSFAPSSMGPKVEAACRFAEATGQRAAIGSLADATSIVRGEAGTQVLGATSRSGRWPAHTA
jgi:carbamate kinase